jgi:hypothetical protein
VALGLRGCGYYSTPVSERPFHPQYEVLKPSGLESHGYGVIGTLLIIVGVTSYSSRKRLRLLRTAGSMRTFLEVHIFLCLVGPTLVLFHTTFKFGGLVAVSAWSMMAVVLSGIVGRYLYTVQNVRGRMSLEITRSVPVNEGLQPNTGMSAEARTRRAPPLHPRRSNPAASLTFDLGPLRVSASFSRLGRRKIPSHVSASSGRSPCIVPVLQRAAVLDNPTLIYLGMSFTSPSPW